MWSRAINLCTKEAKLKIHHILLRIVKILQMIRSFLSFPFFKKVKLYSLFKTKSESRANMAATDKLRLTFEFSYWHSSILGIRFQI